MGIYIQRFAGCLRLSNRLVEAHSTSAVAQMTTHSTPGRDRANAVQNICKSAQQAIQLLFHVVCRHYAPHNFPRYSCREQFHSPPTIERSVLEELNHISHLQSLLISNIMIFVLVVRAHRFQKCRCRKGLEQKHIAPVGIWIRKACLAALHEAIHADEMNILVQLLECEEAGLLDKSLEVQRVHVCDASRLDASRAIGRQVSRPLSFSVSLDNLIEQEVHALCCEEVAEAEMRKDQFSELDRLKDMHFRR